MQAIRPNSSDRSSRSSKAIVFADGDFNSVPTFVSIDAGAALICADGGLRHCIGAGLRPSVVIGDFDSTPNELLQIARNRGAEILSYPTDKDRTDLELALDVARERGITEVTVLGALGGRLDHQTANVALLGSPKYQEMDICIVAEFEDGTGSGWSELRMIRRRSRIRGRANDIVTLLAAGGTALNVRTSGLLYPLRGEALEVGSSRGVSNVMTADEAVIDVGQGSLLAIHETRPNDDGEQELDGTSDGSLAGSPPLE